MRDRQHPASGRSLANTCEHVTVTVTVVLLGTGLYAANAFDFRHPGSRGVDWELLGVWLGAGAVCLAIGLCLTAICRQPVNKDD